MDEVGQPQILEPVGLRRGDREDHRARQVAVGVAVDADRSVVENPVDVGCVGGGRERRLGGELEPARRRHQPFAKRDRADVTFADRAQRHQHAHRL